MTSDGAHEVGRGAANPPVVVAEGTARAYELKLRGKTDRAIAELLTAGGIEVSKSTVNRWIKDAIAARVEPLAEEYRAILVDRGERAVDRLESVVERALDRGDDDMVLKAEDRLLRERERLARLKGIDAPTQIAGDLTVNYRLVSDGQVDDGALT